MKRTHAFTVLELVVVIGIICIVAVLLVGAFALGRQSTDRTAAVAKMRQLGEGLLIYARDHDGDLPPEGEALPTWESAGEPENSSAWFNSIPPLVGAKGLADYADAPANFYEEKDLLYLPTAKYPDSRMNRPLFAVSYNSKLRSPKKGSHDVRLNNIVKPAQTVLFQESGLPREKALPGQSDSRYDGQSKSYASRTVARYFNRTLMIFADGHVEWKAADKVVNRVGQAFFPQVGDDGGEVIWTPDPDANPND
jgi:type II secretory pathway pseudopilin PulG